MISLLVLGFSGLVAMIIYACLYVASACLTLTILYWTATFLISLIMFPIKQTKLYKTWKAKVIADEQAKMDASYKAYCDAQESLPYYERDNW